MSFKDLMKRDAMDTIENSDEFAEAIVYTPYGGAAKTISAIVIRNRIEPNSQDQNRSLVNQVIIEIANDLTSGITTINKGQDKVSLPALIGSSNSDWLIVDIVAQDDAMWRLLARK